MTSVPPANTSVATSANEAQAAFAERDARSRAARIARLAPIPVVGWFVFLPLDYLFARELFPTAMTTVIGVRLAVFGVLGLMFAYIRKRPPATARGLDIVVFSVLAVIDSALAVITVEFGGLHSTYGAGVILTMVAPALLELPWKRGTATAAVGVGAYLATTAVVVAATSGLGAALRDTSGLVVFGGQVFLMLTMATIAVAAGDLSHRLRQQVYESRSIGRYRLEKRLGRGGMGEVWAAYHRGLRRDVALKILRGAGPRAASRFEREVQATADLRHPNTVRVFDYGTTDDGLVYYAMELLVGVDLGKLVDREGPLEPARAVHMMIQASRALAEAHNKGMVHRDIKPENIFLASAGGEPDFVKVLDFGIVRLESEGAEKLTIRDELAGTPSFMAPEAARGEQANARSDVYGLGAVFYFLLTGAPPFEGKGAMAVMSAHQHQPVVPPSLRMNQPLPRDVEEIVLACLSKSAEGRPADGAELAELLSKSSLAGGHLPLSNAEVPVLADEKGEGEGESPVRRTVSDSRETRPMTPRPRSE